MVLLVLLSAPSCTVRLWADRLTYRHLRGRTIAPKDEIASIGYETLPMPSSLTGALLMSVKKPAQPRLYLKIVDGRDVWLDELWAPPRGAKGGLAERGNGEKG
jgi:hypothetical protein